MKVQRKQNQAFPARLVTWVAILGIALLGGCISTHPKIPPIILQSQLPPNRPVPAGPAKAKNAVVTEESQEPIIPLQLQHRNDDANSALPVRNLTPPANPGTPADYDLASDMTATLKHPDEKVKVQFNFDADEVPKVVEQFAAVLDFQYYIDPGVSGTVTMTIDTEMTRKESWQLFEHILWIAGAYVSRNNGFVHILPFSKMPEERRLFARHKPIPNVTVEIIRLYNTAPTDIAGIIKTYLTQGATATPIPGLNSLLIVEAPSNMAKIRHLIKELDVLGESRWPQTAFRCRYVEAETIVDELKTILPVLGFPVGDSEKSDGHSLKIVQLPRQQIILAAAPTREVLREIQNWIAILDREDSGEDDRVYFYNVKYNKAEDLSDAVGVFFTSTSTRTGRSSSSRTNSSSHSSRTPASRTPSGSTAISRTATHSNRTRNKNERPRTVFDVPVTMYADGGHNRLVIRTTPRAYALLSALLKRLDTPPLQVLIKVTIAEIQLTKDTEFGFSYAALNKLKDYNLGAKVDPGSIGSAGSNGLNLLLSKIKDPDKVFAFIRAVAGKGHTRILFTPQVIAISDQEATINVGDSVPIVTQENNQTSGDNISRSIQYQDTGIILTVTPHITAKKLVTLDLKQEVSDAVQTTSSDINSPTIQSRMLQTSLIVEDGETVLLGGLISNRDVRNSSGIPVLHKIPYLGRLFSHQTTTNRRQELLMLIHVNVIDSHTRVDQMIQRYHAAVETLRQTFPDANSLPVCAPSPKTPVDPQKNKTH